MAPSPSFVSFADDAAGPPVATAHSHADEEFLQSLEQDRSFVQLLAHHSRRFKVPTEEMQDFSEKVSRICWSQAQQAPGQGAMAAKLQQARQELEKAREDSKTKLVQCNLNAMKQLDVAKGGTGEPPEDETVFFYEPLQYLSKDQKDLVVMIILDKLRQIFEGTAPASLLEELRRHMALDASKLSGIFGEEKKRRRRSEDDDSEEEENAWERADRAEEAAKAARRQAEEAKSRAAQVLQDLRQLRAEAEAAASGRESAQVEREEVQAESEKLRRQLEAAMEKLRQLGVEPDELAELLSAAAEGRITRVPGPKGSEGFEACISNIPADCTDEDILQLHRDHGLASTDAALPRVVSLDQHAHQAVCRYARQSMAQQAVDKLGGVLLTTGSGKQQHVNVNLREKEEGTKQESKRVAKGMQTDIEGSKVDGWSAENKKLRVCLDELQTKIKELVEKCKQKGIGGAVTDVAKSVGLKHVLSNRTCFERLYQDAFRRIERLEELRRRVWEERSRIVQAAMDDLHPGYGPSVLAEVQQSPLDGLRRFLSGMPGEASEPSAPANAHREPPAWSPAQPTSPVKPGLQCQHLHMGQARARSETRDRLPQLSPTNRPQPLSPQPPPRMRLLSGSVSLPALHAKAVPAR